MAKQFNFDLTVAANALNCPNPSAWYDSVYLGAVDPKYFNIIPGVKDSTKVSTAKFPSVLQSLDCAFAATSSSLSATTVTVSPLKVNVSICKSTLENSFIVNEMRQGSQNYTVDSFMAYYWETLKKEVQQELSILMFQGNETGTGATYTGSNAYKTLTDGYEKKLGANSEVIDVTLTAVTSSSVIGAMTAVINAAPAAIKSANSSAVLYAASDVVLAYRIAAALGNTLAYITGEQPLKFLNFDVVECAGMTSGNMIFTRPDNLVIALDGTEDADNLVAIDQLKTVGIPNILTVALLAVGYEILNPAEIVFFH